MKRKKRNWERKSKNDKDKDKSEFKRLIVCNRAKNREKELYWIMARGEGGKGGLWGRKNVEHLLIRSLGGSDFSAGGCRHAPWC